MRIKGVKMDLKEFKECITWLALVTVFVVLVIITVLLAERFAENNFPYSTQKVELDYCKKTIKLLQGKK